jgi:ABC-2 type transport system permease protein
MRLMRQLGRQPWFIAFTLLQPIIWLLLFGQLFKHIVDLPGFGTASYVTFVIPGIVTMSALYSSGFSGMGILNDLNAGIMDRFLVSPVTRLAMVTSRLVSVVVGILVQFAVLVGLGLLLGARYSGGLTGLLVLLLMTILLALPFGALSFALALSARKDESVIGAVNFFLMPLTFLSTAFMAKELMPSWIRTVSAWNPANWSIEVGRAALVGTTDWHAVIARIAFLAVFTLIACWIAAQSIRSYQSSI